MGWTYECAPQLTREGPAAVGQYVTDHVVTWTRDGSGCRVLASAMVGNTWYGAVQSFTPSCDGPVYGLVVHTRRIGRAADGYNFGVKMVSEDMGPAAAEAPLRIVTLLSPTDNASALDWRERCLEALRRRRVRQKRNDELLVEGARVRLPEPISFSDGVARGRFVVEGRDVRRFRFRCRDTGAVCRLSPYNRARLLPDSVETPAQPGIRLQLAA